MNTNTHTMNHTTTRTSRHPAQPAGGARTRRKSPVLSRRELRRLVRGMLG
jgi:hypothetical protein